MLAKSFATLALKAVTTAEEQARRMSDLGACQLIRMLYSLSFKSQYLDLKLPLRADGVFIICKGMNTRNINACMHQHFISAWINVV